MAKLVLTSRFGHQNIDPEQADLERALAEVFHESDLNLPEGDLVEHPSCWLTHGWEAGDKWVVLGVDVYRGGIAVLSKYADQDDVDPEYEYRRKGVDEPTCLDFWDLLARGDESTLLARFRDGS